MSAQKHRLSTNSAPSSTKRRKVFVELPRLEPRVLVVAAGHSQPDEYNTSSWAVKRGRGRSLSVDSVSESGGSDEFSEDADSESGNISSLRKYLDAVEIGPKTVSNLVYRPGSNEIVESRNIRVLGESPSDSDNNNIPVRFLDNFTFYDNNRHLLPFEQVITSLSSPNRITILASGTVTPCLENGQPSSPKDGHTELSIALSTIIDFWTDYTTRSLTGLWNIQTIAIKTHFAWYILREPAELYTSHYQPFWLTHFVTWRAIHAMRQKPSISYQEFLEYLKKTNDTEFLNTMGREVLEYDLSHSSVVTYLIEQLSGKIVTLKSMKDLPLVQHFIKQIGLSSQDNSLARTIATSRVFRVSKHLFHHSLLADGEMCLSPPSQIGVVTNPPILHPENPSGFTWGDLVSHHSGFYSSISIDGETYTIGDTIIVEPGEDDLTHRAVNAKQPYSRAHQNELGDSVWRVTVNESLRYKTNPTMYRFCRILYMFETTPSGSDPEPLLHVQWFEHSSKTVLQETAHPYELFALHECDDIPIGSIMGRVNVLFPELTNLDPEGYYCRFIWDFKNSRFLDYMPSSDIGTSCESCNRRHSELNNATECSSKSLTFKNIQYHLSDFVYIAKKSSRIYTIGQIVKFSQTGVSNRWQVEVLLFGRFDDVARLAHDQDQQYDERRLFLTDEKIHISPENLEGKCWVRSHDETETDYGLETFYVDRWAPTQMCPRLSELRSLERKLKECHICLEERRQKYDQLRSYKRDHVPLRTMELFAGAGGLSTGLEQTGLLKSYWAVELSSKAAATFQANHTDCIVYNEDTNVCLQSALDKAAGRTALRLKTVNDGTRLMPQPGEVDFIAGGFPCQSFSGMNHQRRNSDDDIRTTLVVNMLSYVDFYRPRFVLMENVKGLLQHHSRISHVHEDIIDNVEVIKMSVVKFILRTLLHIGYQAQFRILEAADYGSPQRRERVIFMAARCGETLPPFPIPTHVSESYRGKTIILPTKDKLCPVVRSERQCAPFRALTVADAISDLPKFEWRHPGCSPDDAYYMNLAQTDPHCKVFRAVSESGRTLVGFSTPVEYRTEPLTRYQKTMRTSEELVTLHCSRTYQTAVVERVWHICKRNKPESVDLPQQFWTAALKAALKSPEHFERVWRARFASRLQWDRAFNTALTSCRPFSKGTSVLHPTQRRIITARECARSQGFPDDYHFVQVESEGRPGDWSKLLDDIHRQIGNAVPIPLARALGQSIGTALIDQWLKTQTT